MDWIFSAVTAGAAAIGVVFSILAYRRSGRALEVAKTEPTKARTRVHRDSVRGALKSALDASGAVRLRLEHGDDLDEVPDAFAASRATLAELGPRLPEHRELGALKLRLMGVSSLWLRVSAAQKRVETNSKWAISWQTRLHDATRPEAREMAEAELLRVSAERDKSARERDAQRAELKSDLRDFISATEAYLRRMDEHDRKGTDPS